MMRIPWPPIREAIASYLAAQDGPTYTQIRAHFEEMGAPYARIDLLEALLCMCIDGEIVQDGTCFHLQKREASCAS
jgi:hypothetical protein